MSSDAAVVTALKAELEFELKDYTPLATSFGTLGWTLDDRDETSVIKLRKEYSAREQLIVTVNVNEFNVEDSDDELEDEEEEEEEESEGDSVDDWPFVKFEVTIDKQPGDEKGQKLVCQCRYTSRDEEGAGRLKITDIALEPKAERSDAEQDEEYDGPVFSNLDMKVQDAFGELLKERGINEELAEQLLHIASNKETRCYTTWLRNMASYIEAS